MSKSKLPFDLKAVYYQIRSQIPDPAGTNNFKLWFDWITKPIIDGVGSEKVIFITGNEPEEVLIPFESKNTTILFTGDAGKPDGVYRIRWYKKLKVGDVVKLSVVVAQSLIDTGNNEFPINIEADTVNAREHSELAIYSDPNATQKEQSIQLKRPTTVFYITKRISPQTGLPEVIVFGSHESEAVVADSSEGGGTELQ